LPTARSAKRALQALRDEQSPPPSYFAKTGLLVRADAPFSLRVAGTALIGWGDPSDFGSVFMSDGCPGEGWLAFPGGFRVERPTCLEVMARTDQGEISIQVGVGAPCAGQRPPVAPSDS